MPLFAYYPEQALTPTQTAAIKEYISDKVDHCRKLANVAIGTRMMDDIGNLVIWTQEHIDDMNSEVERLQNILDNL